MPIDTTPTEPTTLLEALNNLLEAARIDRVSSYEAVNQHSDAASAKAALDDVSREVQREGWTFNTEPEYLVEPTVAGELVLPANTLKVTSARYQSGNRLTHRGLRLYDPKLRTFIFTGSAEVDLVVGLEFNDLPQAFKSYITAMAARRWALPKVPEGTTFRYTEEAVQHARNKAEQEETEALDQDMGDTSPHIAMHRRR